MDRRSLIKNAGIAGVLAAGAAPAVHAQPVVRWRLASSFPRSLDIVYGCSELFAKMVKSMSGGKFEISIYSPGELIGVQRRAAPVAPAARRAARVHT